MSLDRFRSQAGLVAKAGGGQTGATLLSQQSLHQITTVATAGDSLMLPPGVNGMTLWAANTSANSANLFPSLNETINNLSANASFAITAGKAFRAFCPVDGKWYVGLDA
jgi:hypothetical protein